MNSYELNNNEVSPKIIKFLFYQIKLIFDTFFKSNIEKIFNFFVGSYNLFSVKNEEKNIEKCFIFLPLVSGNFGVS